MSSTRYARRELLKAHYNGAHDQGRQDPLCPACQQITKREASQ